MNIDDAPSLAKNNLFRLSIKPIAGCYSCMAVFSSEAITQYTDEGTTAMCPRCKVDAVVAGESDTDELMRAHMRWFSS